MALPDTNNSLHYSQETIKTKDDGVLKIAVDLTVQNQRCHWSTRNQNGPVRHALLLEQGLLHGRHCRSQYQIARQSPIRRTLASLLDDGQKPEPPMSIPPRALGPFPPMRATIKPTRAKNSMPAMPRIFQSRTTRTRLWCTRN